MNCTFQNKTDYNILEIEYFIILHLYSCYKVLSQKLTNESDNLSIKSVTLTV